MLGDQRGEVREQVAPTREAALADEPQGVPGLAASELVGIRQQGHEIGPVLRASPVVAGKHLERDQMARPGHRRPQAFGNLEALRRGDDLGLDAGGREQEINDRLVVALAQRDESHRGKPAGGLLLDRGYHAVTASLKVADERLCVLVTAHEDG